MRVYKQIGEYDCMLACIAMVVQKPIEELWPEEFRQTIERKQGTHGDMIDNAMEVAGLQRNTDYWCVTIPQWQGPNTVRQLLNGRRAIIQVRSLNNQGAGHFIYWAGEQLYDVSNKQQYRWIDQCFPEYVWIFDERGLKLRNRNQ